MNQLMNHIVALILVAALANNPTMALFDSIAGRHRDLPLQIFGSQALAAGGIPYRGRLESPAPHIAENRSAAATGGYVLPEPHEPAGNLIDGRIPPAAPAEPEGPATFGRGFERSEVLAIVQELMTANPFTRIIAHGTGEPVSVTPEIPKSEHELMSRAILLACIFLQENNPAALARLAYMQYIFVDLEKAWSGVTDWHQLLFRYENENRFLGGYGARNLQTAILPHALVARLMEIFDRAQRRGWFDGSTLALEITARLIHHEAEHVRRHDPAWEDEPEIQWLISALDSLFAQVRPLESAFSEADLASRSKPSLTLGSRTVKAGDLLRFEIFARFINDYIELHDRTNVVIGIEDGGTRHKILFSHQKGTEWNNRRWIQFDDIAMKAGEALASFPTLVGVKNVVIPPSMGSQRQILIEVAIEPPIPPDKRPAPEVGSQLSAAELHAFIERFVKGNPGSLTLEIGSPYFAYKPIFTSIYSEQDRADLDKYLKAVTSGRITVIEVIGSREEGEPLKFKHVFVLSLFVNPAPEKCRHPGSGGAA